MESYCSHVSHLHFNMQFKHGIPVVLSKKLFVVLSPKVVLEDRSAQGFYAVNPMLSITRVGTRSYHKAMEAIAPQVRLDLAQANDARK